MELELNVTNKVIGLFVFKFGKTQLCLSDMWD